MIHDRKCATSYIQRKLASRVQQGSAAGRADGGERVGDLGEPCRQARDPRARASNDAGRGHRRHPRSSRGSTEPRRSRPCYRLTLASPVHSAYVVANQGPEAWHEQAHFLLGTAAAPPAGPAFAQKISLERIRGISTRSEPPKRGSGRSTTMQSFHGTAGHAATGAYPVRLRRPARCAGPRFGRSGRHLRRCLQSFEGGTLSTEPTPLALILARNVDISITSAVRDHYEEDGVTTVVVQDPRRRELGYVELKFRDGPVRLVGWRTVDGGGSSTELYLSEFRRAKNTPGAAFLHAKREGRPAVLTTVPARTEPVTCVEHAVVDNLVGDPHQPGLGPVGPGIAGAPLSIGEILGSGVGLRDCRRPRSSVSIVLHPMKSSAIAECRRAGARPRCHRSPGTPPRSRRGPG